MNEMGKGMEWKLSEVRNKSESVGGGWSQSPISNLQSKFNNNGCCQTVSAQLCFLLAQNRPKSPPTFLMPTKYYPPLPPYLHTHSQTNSLFPSYFYPPSLSLSSFQINYSLFNMDDYE